MSDDAPYEVVWTSARTGLPYRLTCENAETAIEEARRLNATVREIATGKQLYPLPAPPSEHGERE